MTAIDRDRLILRQDDVSTRMRVTTWKASIEISVIVNYFNAVDLPRTILLYR
jgi:hypothetical protein